MERVFAGIRGVWHTNPGRPSSFLINDYPPGHPENADTIRKKKAEKAEELRKNSETIRRAHLDNAPRAPVSAPARIENPPETRRIEDRRSVEGSGAVSKGPPIRSLTQSELEVLADKVMGYHTTAPIRSTLECELRIWRQIRHSAIVEGSGAVSKCPPTRSPKQSESELDILADKVMGYHTSAPTRSTLGEVEVSFEKAHAAKRPLFWHEKKKLFHL